jgi:TolB-like protein
VRDTGSTRAEAAGQRPVERGFTWAIDPITSLGSRAEAAQSPFERNLRGKAGATTLASWFIDARLCCISGTMFFKRDAAGPSRERRAAAIAVAPIAPASLDAQQALIASAFLEDVISELARFPNFEVLASRTSLSLTPEQLEPARLHEEFGVTHLLDTSLRPGPGALRMRANLIETASGRLVWSSGYDLSLESLDAVENEVAAAVANQLSTRIDTARLTVARSRPPSSLEAYDLWLRGREVLRRGTYEADVEARALFQQALELDPAYARAYAGLSLSHFNDWSCQCWDRWADGERLAFDYACRAAELDDSDHLVQAVLARIHIYRRNWGQGRHHLERVLALSPNNADALMQTSLWWSFLGEDDRALSMAEKAFRLNPLHEPWYYIYAFLVCFLAGRLEDAVALAEASPPHMMVDQSAYIAAAYAHLGRLDEARRHHDMFVEVFREKITFGREPRPGEPLDYLVHVNPFSRDADRERLLEGLRKAGLTGPLSGGAYRHDDGADSARFAFAGATWQVRYKGCGVHLPDMKGCRDIATLLASPRERFHCMELAGRAAEGDCGQVMDARARAECHARIRDLQAELADAERDGDLARSERLGAELDALIEQLSAAIGLGGRRRRLGDPVEKARTAVTWRIRSAIKRIGEAHPELGRHLKASIRTGVFCAYEPENPVRWATA